MAIVLEATISSSTSLMKFMKSFFCVKVSRKLCRSLRKGSASLETSNDIWLVDTYRQVESLDINGQSFASSLSVVVVTIASKLKWPELPHPTLDTYLREYFNMT